MKSLERLYIDNTEKMDEIVAKTANLARVNQLTIGTGLTDEGLLHLQKMKSLQEITIGPSRITGKGIESLAALPLLRILTLEQVRMSSQEDWVSLGKLSSLEELYLKHTRSEVNDVCIAHLTGLQNLKSLYISAIINKDGQLTYSLDITNEGLKHLTKLKSLESLYLRHAKITDDGLKNLEGLSSLNWLVLQGCKVTEEGLMELKKKLPALRWLL